MSDVWTERLKALGIVIAACAGLTSAVFSGLNHDKVGAIQEKQAVNGAKIDQAATAATAAEVKATVAATDAKTAAVKSAAAQADTQKLIKAVMPPE